MYLIVFFNPIDMRFLFLLAFCLAACPATPLAPMNSMKPYQSFEYLPKNTFTAGMEGPAVDRNGVLFAVNHTREGTIGSVSPSNQSEVFIELPKPSVGNGIRFDSHHNMLIADYVGHNILKVDMATKGISVLAHEPRMNQPNDIAIMDNDIVFASDPNWSNNTGQLWRIMPDGQTKLLEANMGTTNGIEVSPDQKRLYVNESVQKKIWVYDLDAAANISNKRLFMEFPDHGLDGMRCDAVGNLYATRYGKGTVIILTPEGKVLNEITLHGAKPSNLAFGGKDGKTVFVTLQDTGNFAVFLAEHPGRAFTMRRSHSS
jgi:sugar lactone lactonase YvrE